MCQITIRKRKDREDNVFSKFFITLDYPYSIIKKLKKKTVLKIKKLKHTSFKIINSVKCKTISMNKNEAPDFLKVTSKKKILPRILKNK
jgi:hypothetical protein